MLAAAAQSAHDVTQSGERAVYVLGLLKLWQGAREIGQYGRGGERAGERGGKRAGRGEGRGEGRG
jgi:hypothetical protein